MPEKPFKFICGDDDYLVSEKARTWFNEQSEGIEDDLSKEILEGRAGNIAEVEDVLQRFSSAVQTLSLFGERKVVWLKDVNFMADSVTGRAQGTLDLLEGLKSILEGLDSSAVSVLITAFPVDKRRSFYKWVQKKSDFTVLALGKDVVQVCANLVKETCKEAGITIERAAIETLIAKVNANTRLLVEECGKLATYLGAEGGIVTEAMVIELVPNFGDADFFEATDAFFTLDLEWTLEALRRHFFTNNDGRGLLGSMQARNRLLIQLRVLQDAGAIRIGSNGLSKSALESAAREFGRHFGESEEKSNLNIFSQNPYYLGRVSGSLSRAPLKKWVDFQLAFADAFEGIIQRPNEQEEVFRELAVKCLADS